MRLHVVVEGEGSRTAVLVHGMMSDHRAWNDVVPVLLERGYRVVRVDLAGHGRSGRARRYSTQAWADDVVETVEPLLDDVPDLVMGHSLGALVASIAAERLCPRALVYVDPAFSQPPGVRGAIFRILFALYIRPGRRMLVRMNPRWTAEHVDVELDSNRLWHRRTILGLVSPKVTVPPQRLVAPSLVLRSEGSFLVPDALAERLREEGMHVHDVPGAGHTIFRDDLPAFVRELERWLDERDAQAAGGEPSDGRELTRPVG